MSVFPVVDSIVRAFFHGCVCAWRNANLRLLIPVEFFTFEKIKVAWERP